MQENRFAVFKFKVTVRAHMIKYMTVSNISIDLLIFFTPKFSWMAHHHKLERCVFVVVVVVVVVCVCKN